MTYGGHLAMNMAWELKRASEGVDITYCLGT